MRSDVRLRTIPVVVITGLRHLSDYAGLYAGPVIQCFFQVDAPEIPPPEAYLDKAVDRPRLMAIVNDKLGTAQPVSRSRTCLL